MIRKMMSNLDRNDLMELLKEVAERLVVIGESNAARSVAEASLKLAQRAQLNIEEINMIYKNVDGTVSGGARAAKHLKDRLNLTLKEAATIYNDWLKDNRDNIPIK